MEKLYRIEKDFLGEKQIETSKYYGIQTLRAKENFNITKTDISLLDKMPPESYIYHYGYTTNGYLDF